MWYIYILLAVVRASTIIKSKIIAVHSRFRALRKWLSYAGLLTYLSFLGSLRLMASSWPCWPEIKNVILMINWAMQFWDKHFCVYQVTFLKCGTMRYVCVSFLPLAGADGRKGTRVHRPSLPLKWWSTYVRTYLREKKKKKKKERKQACNHHMVAMCRQRSFQHHLSSFPSNLILNGVALPSILSILVLAL